MDICKKGGDGEGLFAKLYISLLYKEQPTETFTKKCLTIPTSVHTVNVYSASVWGLSFTHL